MKKYMDKINVIFTDRFLKYWYIACALIIALMIFNHFKLSQVSSYELTLYNNDGTVNTVEVVSAEKVAAELESLPVSKSFHPIK